MSSETNSITIRGTFAGAGVLLTGSTGFLAKAVTEKILRDLPEVGQIFLLIRPRVKADGTRVDPRERLRDEILRNSAFGRLREKHGDEFLAYCESKITCVPGDLTAERLGLDETAFNELAKKVKLVINSAATVVFDERLDLALDLNTMGPQRLLELARAANAAYVHISTAYVSGKRTGNIPEKLLTPLEAIDAQLPTNVKRPEKFDVKEEVARLGELAASVKKDCETIFAKKKIAPDSEEGKDRMRTALVDAGMRRAQSLGWNDTYTYTKFLGEQFIKLTHGDVPTIIVRPSIIESSLREPEPGWLDGLRMADPIIIGFGKGRLTDFPASEKVVLDIIPADLVVNGILAAAAHIAGKRGAFDLITVASSSENPLVFRTLFEYVRDYFQKHPMTDRAGKPVIVPMWKFPTIAQYRWRIKNRYLRPIKAANLVLNSPIPVPGGRRLKSRLRTLSNTLEQLLYYVDIYGPYVNLECRYEIGHALELLSALPPDERAAFDFDPRAIRWKSYLQDVHIPGLKRNILRMESVPRTGAGEGTLLDEEKEKALKRIGARKETGMLVRGVPQTVVDLCARGADRYGDKALVEIRRGGAVMRITYAEMYERASELARKLIPRLGLIAGDRVVLMAENSPEWALAYLSVSRANCTVVPLDRMMPEKDALRLAKLVEAKAIVVSPAILKNGADEFGDCGLPLLNVLNELNPHEGSAWTYPEASMGERPLRDPAPESPASILFTSGTTREPKGVMLSHANVVADALAVAEVLEPMQNDRFLSVLPLHHAFEFSCGFLIPMYGGSTIHHIESIQDIAATMKLAEITVVLGVPRLFQLFMDRIKAQIAASGTVAKISASVGKSLAGTLELFGNPDARKSIFKKVHDGFGGHVRLFVCGGAPLDPEIYTFFKDFGITICEGYGLTETSPVLTVNPLSATKAGSVGPAVPGVEMRIHAPGADGIGEVRARGPVIMQGYWRNPDATAQVFESGWFKTGDLGRIDKDGYLHITGRLKDVIVTTAGKNVYPDEIELALKDIAGVKELCVVGLPSRAGHGEEVAAVIVLKNENMQGGSPHHNALRNSVESAVDRANQALPSHQRVARVEFQDEDLPKTSTLKIQRNKVRERYAGGGKAAASATALDAVAVAAAQSDVAARESAIFVEVARTAAELSGRMKASELSPSTKLEIDLALDSIARMDLISKLELRFNVRIPPGHEGKLFTLRDAVTVVEDALKAGGAPASSRLDSGTGILSRSSQNIEDVKSSLKGSVSKTVLQGVFGSTASVFMNTWLRVEGRGLENIPPGGAYILAANHCSHLDSMAIREVLGSRAKSLHVMGAKDYFFDTTLKSWFFSTFLNALPFDREENIADGLALCKTVLDSGRAILLFPEGTRSITGELQSFRSGVGVLAVELDVPIVPVNLRGTFESLPKGRMVPRPKRIAVTVGKPVDFSAIRKERGAAQATELYRRAANELRARIEALG
ncbi:MAG TPA: AMP-binding protein [Planctomycetota bacterium]|nr:AMP-binding protein [Planctomycetota bacterium]